MKRLKRTVTSSNAILADTDKGIGTTYYVASLKEVKDAIINSKDVNIWVKHVIEKYGFDAIDFNKGLFGSRVVDGNLYICKTDGQNIVIDGYEVDPEFALEEYPIDKLDDYIEPADSKLIIQSISDYEVKFENIDEIAVELLNEGNSFEDVVKSAYDISLIDIN